VVIHVPDSGGKAQARQVRLAQGDEVSLPPSGTARILSVRVADGDGRPLPGLIALARGDAEPGWSGRPVLRDGLLIGIVHGATSEHLIVLLLPVGA
jgi:hypothetical protein